MKAAVVLAAIAAAAHAKVASSVLRALEVEGKTDVFVRFAGSALESAVAEGATRQEVFEVLTEATEEAQKSIEDVTRGFETKPLWIVKGTIVKAADQALVDKLASHRGIKAVEHLPEMELEPVLQQAADAAPSNATVQWGVESVGATSIWKHYNGKGVVIGSIDTGARHTHKLIKDSWRADRGWYDPYNHTALPEDLDGHGTHTIGTMTGKDGFGVAPGAQWISCRGLYTGTGTSQALLECLQFMICPTRPDGTHPDCSKGAHVINNSWGGKRYHPIYEEAISAVRKAGIIPVFANGNAGPACATTGNPGTYPNVISVGAIGSYDNEPNKLAYFSSKGPATYIDAHNVKQTIIKPTISAPGFYTKSAYNTSDDAVVGLAGTSMAAPHVAGVVALLKSAKIDLTYDEIYAYLTKTADQSMLEGEPDKWYKRDVNKTVLNGAPNCGGVSDATFPNNRYGYGRVNVAKIIKDGKFVDGLTPVPTTHAPVPLPNPVNIKFCTYKKTVLSEWNNQLFVDTIKNNKNEGFVIDLVDNIIKSDIKTPDDEEFCLSLVKDSTNTNSVALKLCAGDPTQIWKFDAVAKRVIHIATGFCLTSNAAKLGAGPSVAPCAAGALSQFFDNCDSVTQKSYVKLVTKSNKHISEFYSGVYADWTSDSANELFTYDSNAKTLQVASNGQCLDAFRDGNKFGLHTYTCDASNGNQKWIIDAAGHKIKHATHNNLCLDVDPTNPVHAAQVWECHNWNTNQWIDAVPY
ncbi:serine protease family S08A [Achlya hypogyna]|uniref:subtilisin n=1 Tax=Achlya hypogyna TaxID=1202772 RepID=A0A0A7CPK6_ACHHY|nr:secreted protein [Achlya hypogyna]OQR82575.1 serine protease family S08A [Achlya hypogyna]